MEQVTIHNLSKTLAMLCGKIHDETGKPAFIGFAFEDKNGNVIEGFSGSSDLDYRTACEFLIGIAGNMACTEDHPSKGL